MIMTMGEDQTKYVPPPVILLKLHHYFGLRGDRDVPDIGISSNMMATVENRIPK